MIINASLGFVAAGLGPDRLVDILKRRSFAANMHLEPILAETRKTVDARKRASHRGSLEALAAAHTPRGFAEALRQRSRSGPAIIAELKKASPSKGLIRAEFDLPSLAKSLERGGAACLSVLTEEKFFQGSLSNLEVASTTTQLPCLRKDFIVDEFQILEARAHRADAILLIAAALSDAELRRFNEEAHRLGLDVLCEVHTGAELDRVAALGCDAYGVNNRDLVSFNVSLDVSLNFVAKLPKGAVHVAESGIHTADDLNQLRDAGYDAFLIGESLMRQPDPGAALRQLLTSAVSAKPALIAGRG
jgi:indole-3-glycerol phosphate synthase